MQLYKRQRLVIAFVTIIIFIINIIFYYILKIFPETYEEERQP